MMKIYLFLVSCLFGCFPLFAAALGDKPGVAYLSGGEVWFCSLDHQDTLQLTHAGHHVMDFALSPDKRFLAYSKMFKIVDEPGIWDSIVPQVPVCSIVMLDLKQQKIINEIFPEEYEWLNIDHWVNARQLLCNLSSGFSVDELYLFDTAGRVDTLEEGRWDSIRLGSLQPVAAGSSSIRVVSDNDGSIHLKDDLHHTDTVIFKESYAIRFKAIAPDSQSFVWSESTGGYYLENNTSYMDGYRLYLKNIAGNESKLLLDEKHARDRRFDKIGFSPDNRVISLDRSNGGQVDLYFLNKHQLMTIEGKLVDWIDGRRLLVLKEDHLSIYDTEDQKSVLLMTDARKPQFVP